MRILIPIGLAAATAMGAAWHLAAPLTRTQHAPVADPADAFRPPASLSFEPNVGQLDPRVRFFSRSGAHALFLTDTGAVLRLTRDAARPGDDAPGAPSEAAVLRMTLSGANATSQAGGEEQLAGTSHYLKGNDPAAWQRDVPRFGQVRYHSVYAGIDAVWYGNEGALEYDFVVAPGADPGQIALDFEGASEVSIDADGHLVLDTAVGQVVQHRPIVYQVVDGAKKAVDAAYRLLDPDTVAFALGAFDRSLPLVIDPVVSYSTYLGGDAEDSATSVAVDSAGNTWVAGVTNSTEFPWEMDNDSEFSGVYDAYVCRFSGNGGIPLCAYIGGSDDDGAWAIAIGPDGNAYVGGYTYSADFPVVDAAQSDPGGDGDAFVLRINAAADGLDFSTYHAGNSFEIVRGIAVDHHGDVYVTGETWSANLPTTQGALQASHGNANSQDAFVARFSAAGAREVATYLGGNGVDRGRGIAFDDAGDIFVTGNTASADFPMESPLMPPGGGEDAFLSVLHPSGGALLLSTTIGGSAQDWAYELIVDDEDRVTLAGFTSSADFPVHKAAQGTLRGGQDSFLMRIDMATGIAFSTFLGGSGLDDMRHIAADPAGNTWFFGYTQSDDFPLRNHLAPLRGQDAVLAKFDPAGALLLSTPLGGSAWEIGSGVALDLDGTVHLGGYTTSVDLPLAGAFQAMPGSTSVEDEDGIALETPDIFLARLAEPALDTWRGDYDGDGTDDILMRNNSTGANTIWRSGNSRTTQRMTRILDLRWRIVGVGDFDGDGADDVFWRHATTGGNAIWSGALSNAQLPVSNVTNTNWEVQAVADFDNDGKDDVVWHDPTTGASSLWYSANPGSATNLVTITNLAWDIVGAGDLDGDGQADLIWRVERTGQNAVWRSGDHGDQLAIARVAGAWKIAGIADYHGDGTADLLWRHLQTGRNVLWDGGVREASTNVTPVPGQAWQVAGGGDYDGDGEADILWRNAQTGANSIWRSANSRTRKTVSFLKDPNWTIKS